MIFTNELSKVFDDFLAVDRVSLAVPQGKVLVLLGKNGAGKTTTVRMLTSILRPTHGTARVAGYDVVTQPDKVRASVGVLTEQHGLYGRMNAREYLDFFGSLYGLDAIKKRKRTDSLLESVGLADVGKKRLGEYSKGMRQKLALVRALLHDPPVLLLDEPTSAMDPESAHLVRDAIHTLRGEGRTILLCTHNLAEGEELADQVAIIQDGKIILNDSLEAVKRSLLGPVNYEVRFTGSIGSDSLGTLPNGVTLQSRGENWLRFAVINPEVANPALLRTLLDQQLGVLTFQEVPRSLEMVFLDAVKQPVGGTRREARK
jgi:ABC-2 type transport system ATP-binding protein